MFTCEGVRICFSFTQLSAVREDSSSIFKGKKVKKP